MNARDDTSDTDVLAAVRDRLSRIPLAGPPNVEEIMTRSRAGRRRLAHSQRSAMRTTPARRIIVGIISAVAVIIVGAGAALAASAATARPPSTPTAPAPPQSPRPKTAAPSQSPTPMPMPPGGTPPPLPTSGTVSGPGISPPPGAILPNPQHHH